MNQMRPTLDDVRLWSAYNAGQEAMRERAAAVCDHRAEAHRATDNFVAMEGGAVDKCVEAEECAAAIRALEVQP